MLGRKATKRIDLVLYVKITDFSEYAYKKLRDLPKIAKYNSCNDFLLKLFENNIQISKLIKVGNNEKIQYCLEIQNNYKLMLVILMHLYNERYITSDTYKKIQNNIEEILKLNLGYLKHLQELI